MITEGFSCSALGKPIDVHSQLHVGFGKSSRLHVHERRKYLCSVQDTSEVDRHDVVPALMHIVESVSKRERRGRFGQQGSLVIVNNRVSGSIRGYREDRDKTDVVHKNSNLSV
jgi:GTP cyclohydrolase II